MESDAGIVEVELNHNLTPELESARDLGSVIDEAGFYVAAATNPICLDVRKLFETQGPLDKSIKLYDSFKLWLVPNRISVMRRKGFAEPTSVGLEVEYITDGHTCSIVGLLPSPQFIQHGSVALGGQIGGSISATGDLSPTAIPDGAISKEQNIASIGSLKLQFSSNASLGFNFSANVITPSISAVGLGSSRAEWRFDRHEEALFGRDIETWTVLALPKRQKQLSYRLRFNITTRLAFFPTRRESDWLSIACELG